MVGCQFRAHVPDQTIIGRQQRAAERVGGELAAEVVEEIGFAAVVKKLAQARDAGALLAAGERRAGIDGTVAEIFFAPFAHRAEAFEYETEGVDAGVAARAGFIFAMPGERVAQREVAHLGLVGRQGGDGRRGRRDALAEQATDDPVAAFHGTGAQARRIRGEKNGHR